MCAKGEAQLSDPNRQAPTRFSEDHRSRNRWFAGDEMDAGFDFTFQGSTLGWLAGRGRTVAFARYLESRHRARAGHHLAHFLSSHDVAGALHLLGGDRSRFRLAALLQLTVIGTLTETAPFAMQGISTSQ